MLFTIGSLVECKLLSNQSKLLLSLEATIKVVKKKQTILLLVSLSAAMAEHVFRLFQIQLVTSIKLVFIAFITEPYNYNHRNKLVGVCLLVSKP